VYAWGLGKADESVAVDIVVFPNPDFSADEHKETLCLIAQS
jgi:hypothetical protein